jgi:predicted O-methyltransferase YrrM
MMQPNKAMKPTPAGAVVSRTTIANMNDAEIRREPAAIRSIVADTQAMSFNMLSEPKVGALLATLAASKPSGRFLELGTGTGHGTAWLLAGMDAASTLDTVDTDESVVAVAQRHLGGDGRVRFHIIDGATFLHDARSERFDLIYADAWPGKFSHLEEALALLRPGGIYVIDDLLPQPNWPEGHAPKVPALVDDIERREQFAAVRLAWASGLMLVVRKAG